jgi:hypothetical protein
MCPLCFVQVIVANGKADLDKVVESCQWRPSVQYESLFSYVGSTIAIVRL